MTSHLLFPAIDEQWPATLSEKIIGRIIREMDWFQWTAGHRLFIHGSPLR